MQLKILFVELGKFQSVPIFRLIIFVGHAGQFREMGWSISNFMDVIW